MPSLTRLLQPAEVATAPGPRVTLHGGLRGVDRLSSLVLSENLPTRRLLTRLGARFDADSPGVLSVALEVAPVTRELVAAGCGGPR